MKSLVVYYSFEGYTKLMAESIAKTIEADAFELKVKNDVKSHGFMKYVFCGRQVFTKKKPELMPFDVEISDYDLIIIGTPVWAGSFTPAIRTFLSENNLEGKKVAIFCTHMGGKGKIFNNIENELKDSKIISEMDFNQKTEKVKNIKTANKWVAKVLK